MAKIKPITTKDWVEIQASEDNIVAPRPKNSDFNLNKIKSSGFIPEDYERLLEDYVIKLIQENGLIDSP